MAAALTTLAAIGREEIAEYVNAVFLVYIILILIRVLLSWIPRMPFNPYLRAFVDFVHQTTDPYLNIFRRIIPSFGGGGMQLDLSPIIALILLFILQGIVVGAIDPG